MMMKFVEDIDYGRVTNRVCYALDSKHLPATIPAARWRQIDDFNEAEALAKNPTFSRVLDCVRLDGFAMVSLAPL